MSDIKVTSETTCEINGKTYACAIGKGGFVAPQDKREGDHKTPTGRYGLRAGYYRKDKELLPVCALDLAPIEPHMGWCDDSSHSSYNQPVNLPFAASHEKLWHDFDDCYDIIVPIGYNDDPVRAGRGSAIFFHIAHDDYRGTEGCVAISKADMFEILPQLGQKSTIHILTE